MMFSREQKLAHINKSPESVALHDKGRWLSIFSPNSIVEDPVGSTPHVSGTYDKKNKHGVKGKLSRFYDTFIQPNNIVFDVARDVVCEDHVVRDLTVNIDMSGVKVSVPMHLLYELVEEDEELKIRRLAAHWELMPMVSQLMSKGTSALPVMTTLSKLMMKNQGLSGSMGFMAGLTMLTNKDKQVVEAFRRSFNGKDESQLLKLFSSDAVIRMPFGEGDISPPEILKKHDGNVSLSKILLAGYAITATVEYHKEGEDEVKQGVAVFEFDTKTKKIKKLTFYFE